MDHQRFRSLITACVLALAAYVVHAQTDPQLKPGLWQIHIEREVNGQKAPDMADRMKNMSPETRAKMEAAMKQRGIEAGDNGGTKACYSKDMLSQSRWAEQQTGCKYDFSTRSSTSWKWHYTCPQLALEGDGEASFSSPENYVVKSSSVTNTGGKARTSHTTITANWLGADCGDLKPLQVKP